MRNLALVAVVAIIVVGATIGTLGAQTSTGEEDTVPAGYVPQAEHDAVLVALDRARARVVQLRAEKRTANRHRSTWKRRHHRLHRILYPYSSAWRAAALCIHREEGSWKDPNAPYYGGMQMDISFQRAYGRRWLNALGTADRWLPVVQLLVSYRGYLARGGWNPWPNTARRCGLPLFAS